MQEYDKCLICGITRYHTENVTGMQCMFCGESFYTNYVCANGHYVCDGCQMERALEIITSTCEKSKTKEAVALAFELMTNKWIKMNGQEHPYLVAATLLTVFKNRGYSARSAKRNFPALLDEAKKRTSRIAINSCGYWGCAGEAIGCGIFASLILRVSPTSKAERGAANMLTSKVLEQISLYGGPRCSKRESLLAILVTSQFTDEKWKMPLTDFDGVECIFFNENPDCIYSECPFFPKD